MTEAEEEQLFDVLIPPGVPRKIIIEIPQKFNVKVVERLEPLRFANMDGEKRQLLAFRGSLDEVKKVEKYLIDQLKAFIEEK